jgi:hypothetical protein
MILVGIPVLILIVIIGVRFGLPAVRRRRIAAELRGDWWPRFERDFRAYASRSWHTAREREQRG